jgi:putative membrane-bound dehydrogenase-like protein
MTRWVLVLGLGTPAALLAAAPATRPLPADAAARGMALPDGFHATVFAAEPDVVQPISFCTDARGRLFVAEALNYGEWRATGKDRVVILEDKEGDGRAVTRKVFYEGFNYITGIEVGFGGVWVISPPGLYFVPCREGDDKPAGPPQVVFDGFGYKESRHNLANGFTWGPDGWLYAGHGRTSPSDVGPPGTPAARRVHCDGGVYRIHPARRVFENFADGTTNPWGVDFDDYGECFVSNCVNPHLYHMIQGGHYEPWRGRPASLYAYERLPTCADHLHYAGGRPGEMRGETAETLALGGGHAHCGTLVYLADLFPARFRNTVLMCNVHGRRVNNDVLRRKGSGYTAGHGKDFMIAADPWFMGVTLRTGPDGGVYVSDWSDTGECHTYRPDATTGRIYKITYGHPAKARADLTRLGDDELVKLQLHPNDWYVRHARRLLQERASAPGWEGGQVHAALREMLYSRRLGEPRRLRALWALHVTGGLDEVGLLAGLDDPGEHVRAWSVRLSCEGPSPGAQVLGKFRELARGDPSPVVRLALASALQRLPPAVRWGVAGGLLGHPEDAADANLPLMDWYGVEPLVPADPARALRLAAAARIPLVRQFVARRAADDAVARGESGDLTPLADALAGADEAVRLDLLRGAREGLRGRQRVKMPAGWPAAYARLAHSGDPEVRENAVMLALAFGDPRALADLRATAADVAAPAGRRQAALAAFIEQRPPGLAPLLHGLLADPALRRQALRGLASAPDGDTPRRVLAVYPGLTAGEKQDAVATLASRREYAVELLQAVEAKAVPRGDISAYTARQLHALGDPRVSEQLRKVWGEVRDTKPDRQKQLARYKGLLTPAALKAADPRNGRLLFGKTCGQCHKLFGEGGAVGPDLTGHNRAETDYLLAKLVDPGAQLANDYRMSVVATRDGRVITGIIAERSPRRLVLQTATERIVLAAEDVETVEESSQSMMPEGQLDALTREQVRDLIAYLSGKGQVPFPPDGPKEGKRPGAPGGR